MATGGQGERGTGGETAPTLFGLERAGIRVRFERRGDRYGHAIERLTQEGWRDVLLSLEGSPGERWPPSPPLQSLRIEELSPGQFAALLVGMAGQSHWSMSVEADAATGRLTFDVACRPGDSPERLGSGYERVSAAALALLPDAAPGLAPAIADAGGRIILVAPTPSSAAVKTIRWRYSVG